MPNLLFAVVNKSIHRAGERRFCHLSHTPANRHECRCCKHFWTSTTNTSILSLSVAYFNFNFVTLTRAASQPVALLYSPVLNWLSPDVPVQNQNSNLSSEILDRSLLEFHQANILHLQRVQQLVPRTLPFTLIWHLGSGVFSLQAKAARLLHTLGQTIVRATGWIVVFLCPCRQSCCPRLLPMLLPLLFFVFVFVIFVLFFVFVTFFTLWFFLF